MKHLIRLLALALLAAAAGTSAQTPPPTPEVVPATIDYQGKIYDSAGKPYGVTVNPGPPETYTPNPTNYTITFRIWDAPSGGSVVWAESQVVTVSNGQFSVSLGEGAVNGSDPHPGLATVFAGATPVRYLGVTVGTTGEISPRLAFLTTPFAFTAQHAQTAATADAATTAATATTALTVNQTAGTASFSDAAFAQANVTGTLSAATLTTTGTVTAGSFAGDGAGITGIDASKITTGTLPAARLPSEAVRTDGNNTFTGANNFNSIFNSFTGNGSGLSNLNANNVTSGKLRPQVMPDAAILGYLNDKPLYLRSISGATLDNWHGLVYGKSAETLNLFSNDDGQYHYRVFSDLFNVDGPVLYGSNGGALGAVYIASDTGQVRPRIALSWNANAQVTLAGAPTISSDARLKEDISPVGPVLDSVLKLAPVRFRYKSSPATAPRSTGFLAQDVQKIFPDSVVTGSNGYLSLNYDDLGVYAIRAIQELAAEDRAKAAAAAAELQRLRDENASLRRDIGELQRRLDALEAK